MCCGPSWKPKVKPMTFDELTTESGELRSRLGPLAWRSSGRGPAVVFFAGALANGELWRGVVTELRDRYRCIIIDLPLGAHNRPLNPGADRSATSLARLIPESLELLDLDDATVVANDTAGGLLLLALAGAHPGLRRIGRLVLTNCDNYENFPPPTLRRVAQLCRIFPALARAALRRQARSPKQRRQVISSVVQRPIDDTLAESFFGPLQHNTRIADDLVAALGGCRPQLLLDAAPAIPRFDHPVLLVWGDACQFFPIAHAHRLAAEFPHTTLVSVPGAKTWVPIDDPTAVSRAITEFVPAAR